MGEFSIIWALFIVAITLAIYKLVRLFVRDKNRGLMWLVAAISVCVYSGIGISYEIVPKRYILDYAIYLAVLGLSFAAFSGVSLSVTSAKGGSGIGGFGGRDNDSFWNSRFAARLFTTFLVLYFLFRVGSLVYPENRLASLTITYEAVNNLKNISGENANIMNSFAAYIRPFAFIGFMYAVKRVRYVAALLGFDLLITLLYTGYLTRNLIICVVFIALMLYYNNDLSNEYLSLDKKRRRLMKFLGIIGPIVLYMMLYLMTIRTTGKAEWTIMGFFASEIDYPKHYDIVTMIAGALMTPADMFFHILDSFVPFIPTPGYTANINVLFSEAITGVSMTQSWFSVLLPSIMGESILIFGSEFFWVHAVVIAFMMSMILRIVGDNPKMTVLFYFYLTCVMKAARAGYAELSSTVMFNFVIMVIVISLAQFAFYSLRRGGKKRR